MEVFDDHPLVDCFARAFVGGAAVQVAFFHATTEQQYTAGVGEVAMHAVVLQFGHDIGHGHLIFDLQAWFTFEHHVAAEFAGQDDKRAVEQASGFKVFNEESDGSVDHFFQIDRAGVTVIVGVPVFERDVFAGYLDEPCAGFDKPAGEQTTQSESSGVVGVVRFPGFQRQIERFCGLGSQQTVRIIKARSSDCFW